MSVNSRGFSLTEMLVAVAISSVLMLGVARMLPLLQRQNMQLMAQVQLQEALQQMMMTMEKAVRRAGYCNGECVGDALRIRHHDASCLLVAWDENSNGQWEGSTHPESEWYGYRLRNQSLEMQRGVNSCDGNGWERLSDPGAMTLSELHFARDQQQIKISLTGHSLAFPHQSLSVVSWIYGANLP